MITFCAIYACIGFLDYDELDFDIRYTARQIGPNMQGCPALCSSPSFPANISHVVMGFNWSKARFQHRICIIRIRE